MLSELTKSPAAQAILARRCDISVQILNEFSSVARRKLAKDWQDIQRYLAWIEAVCLTVHPVDLGTHHLDIELAQRYHLAVFDAMIVATALRAGATVLHSEDMQHGLLVENQLRISNPFIAG